MGDVGRERELRKLRERAYGPNADIDSDPRALARLRELEAEHEGLAAESPVADADIGGVAPASGPAASDAVAAVIGSQAEVSRSTRRRHGLWIAWAASIALVAVLASAATVWITSPVRGHYATLSPVPSPSAASWMPFAGPDAVLFEEFYGIGVASAMAENRPCILVRAEPSLNDSFTATCTSPQFAPTVDVTVHTAIAPEAAARFGDGATIRFTLIDGVVTVDVGPAATSTAPAAP